MSGDQTPYAETEMLIAALEGNDERLDRLARNTYPSERKSLHEALHKVSVALIHVEANREGFS